jgi:polyphosphate kinase
MYYFHNAGDEQIYLGSADLMPRNLNRRVEVIFPVEDPRIIRHIRDDILETYLSDNAKARLMLPDGSYERLQPNDDEPALNSQSWLLDHRLRTNHD